ncbi:hypothetical protein [Flaviaesturariibacter aridisoli]|uniref:Uncharacterized protein n=1 Tax=Flaviaesturariibacter aridisoli TaxID=2545761 RepID=A0A4R4E892_9BACT|nr:hypothetical protein [Flaviaesturariibacter aridisoli]TCZ73965.1 hypothetical protein E0486_04600 [Flaviaesturariibacter aridisoli]
MKRVLFTTLSLVLLASACRKADVAAPNDAISIDTTQFPATPPPAHPERGLLNNINSSNVIVTDWEPANGWNRSAGDNSTVRYKTSRSFHAITQALMDNGAVLVFSKGYNFADTSAMRPMGMPFSFYLPIERMNFPVYWEYLKKIGGVDVNLQMKEDAASVFNSGQGNIRLRYFVLSQQELQRRGWTPNSARTLSYDQLTSMYGLVP